jgi:hypothetical protein
MLQALCAPFGTVLLDVPISELDFKLPPVGALRGSGHISFLTRVSMALKIVCNLNVFVIIKINITDISHVRHEVIVAYWSCGM